jgi:hypothetical protein
MGERLHVVGERCGVLSEKVLELIEFPDVQLWGCLAMPHEVGRHDVIERV